VGLSIGDSLAAIFACNGALAALHHRDKTGEGQVVDSAIYEAVLNIMESTIPEYAVSGHIRERSGSVMPNIAPSNLYRCADGYFLIAANQDTVFSFQRNTESIAAETALDGLYVIRTSVPTEQMDSAECVRR
tara:strand:- start:162 stop:557 length:396 start_codon:yes stop_codon:yes gene_type:complete